MRRKLIGWGNPLAGDDAVGWHVLDALTDRIPASEDVAVLKTSAGSWRLAEEMLDADRVVLVDACEPAEGLDGVVHRRLWPAPATRPEAGHDASLCAALAHLERISPERMPTDVRRVGRLG
jgi:hydrogenase maturation protease